jgi:hypothetical protein
MPTAFFDSSQTTTTKTPFDEFSEDLGQKAFNIADTAVPYSGRFVAPMNPNELAAFNREVGLASRYRDAGLGSFNLANKTIAGDFLNPSSNPDFRAALEYSLEPGINAFHESLLPRLRTGALDAGAFGGDRALLTEAQLTRDLMRNILGVSAQAGAEHFGRERAFQIAAPEMLRSAAVLDLLEPQLMQEGGAGLRSAEQMELENAFLQHREQYFPLQVYALAADILSSLPVNTESTTTSSGYNYAPGGGGGRTTSSRVGGGVSGALGGAASGAAIGSAIPGIGTVVGAILGALLGGAGGAL